MELRTRRALLWALLPVGLLLVGVVNYFAGGFSAPKEPTGDVARLDFASARMERAYGSSVVLELPWGDSASHVALAKDQAGVSISTLEAVVPEANGGLLVVDHPSWHEGARVQRFGPDGELVDTLLTPPGSTLFSSVEDRIVYVMAKQADDSERLVVREGSRETTYVVPLRFSSGAVLGWGRDIWVTALKTSFDTRSLEVTATNVAIPVVVDGRQVTDEAATEAVREGWMRAGDELYTRRQVSVGAGESADVRQVVGRTSDGASLEVPGRSEPLGVDGDGLLYVRTVSPGLGTRKRPLAATLGSTSQSDEVLVGRFDGRVVGRLVVPGRAPTIGGWPRFAVTSEGAVYAAVSDDHGVRVVRYEGVAQK